MAFEEGIESLEEGPKALKDLAQIGIIYRKVHLDKDPLKQAFERQMLEKHLKRLEKQKQVHYEYEEEKWHRS